MDEFRAWSVVRTQEQIYASMHYVLDPVASTGLRFYYSMETVSGGWGPTYAAGCNELVDETGNGNSGYLACLPNFYQVSHCFRSLSFLFLILARV